MSSLRPPWHKYIRANWSDGIQLEIEVNLMTPRKTHRYFSGLSRSTFLLAFASLFSDISTEMLYPILPIFLTQVLKASGSIVGLVEGVAEATQNIIQGFSGSLSDKLQTRKPIAVVGYALAAISKPLIGLSTVWQGVLGGRFLDRLGAGARSAPRDALIASSVDDANHGASHQFAPLHVQIDEREADLQ